jgi:beta-phosphoglucomutase
MIGMDIRDYVALFDLDGVVMNTEPQYTTFWDAQGMKYLGIPNFCSKIKGQTLTQIYDKYFPNDFELQEVLRNELNAFEKNMEFNYIEGADLFIKDIHQKGIRTALATSSNNDKMSNVYQAHPEFKSLFDIILTANMFTLSKPNPECFNKCISLFHTDAKHAVIFEDSFHGLQAARDSGSFVIGLATTNPRASIISLADCVIDNFSSLNADWLLKTITDNR